MSNENVQAVHSQTQSDASDPATPDRDAKGRFVAGNKGGPGNPFGRRLASMRQAVLRAVTEDDIERIMRVLVKLAEDGDVAAAKVVLQYAVGKPQAAAEPDRIEVDEWELQQQLSVSGDALNAALAGVPIRVANVTSALMSPEKEKQFGQMLREPVPADVDRLTPEDEAEIERINRRFEEQYGPDGRQAAANGPSAAGTNGARPSTAGGNGASPPAADQGKRPTGPSPARRNGRAAAEFLEQKDYDAEPGRNSRFAG